MKAKTLSDNRMTVKSTDNEASQSNKVKSISEKYSEMCDNPMSTDIQSKNNFASRFFEKLNLSNHLCAMYGVYGISSNE